MQLRVGRIPCSSGNQFGSQFPGNPSHSRVYDFIAEDLLDRISNINDFLGVFVFDKWTCNTDKRQAVFLRQPSGQIGEEADGTLQVMMIDQGFCFDGGNWNFPDAPLRNLYFNRLVYRSVVGMESFEPWLDRLESGLSLAVLHEEAQHVPPEWYGEDAKAWESLIERLDARRTRVRELIYSTRNVVHDAFQNWTKSACSMSDTKNTIANAKIALRGMRILHPCL
jgi:hypothetical protein